MSAVAGPRSPVVCAVAGLCSVACVASAVASAVAFGLRSFGGAVRCVAAAVAPDAVRPGASGVGRAPSRVVMPATTEYQDVRARRCTRRAPLDANGTRRLSGGAVMTFNVNSARCNDHRHCS